MSLFSLTILTTRKLASMLFNTTTQTELEGNNSHSLNFVTVLTNPPFWKGQASLARSSVSCAAVDVNPA